MLLSEAVTIRHQARSLLRSAKDLLANKTLSQALRDQLDGLEGALKRTWGDLEAEAADAEVMPAAEAAVAVALTEMIKHEGDKWVLYSKDGSKKLGEFDSEEAAKKREREIQFFKHHNEAMIDQAAIAVPLLEKGNIEGLIAGFGDWAKGSQAECAKALEGKDGISDANALCAWLKDQATGTTMWRGKQGEATGDIEIIGDVIPLVEAGKALRADGTIRARILAPGWGSSGYYSAAMLQRDGPKVFTRGLKSYWDHPTVKEEVERPERSLRDLAGELTTDAAWDANGPAGPGLYSDVKVFKPYQETVAELAPHIGMSIRADGKPRLGEAEGRKGILIEQILRGKSLDFVTQAGAGGQILTLFEAARGRAAVWQPQEETVTEEEAKVLRESNAALAAEVKRLQEAAMQREAHDLVAEAVGKSDLPAPAKVRIQEVLAGTVPLKEGALDKEALTATVGTAVEAERKYIAALVPAAGKIIGMGGSVSASEGTALKESFLRLYKAQGMNEAESEKLANAAAGR
jgi:hypothetical protein